MATITTTKRRVLKPAPNFCTTN